MGRGSGRGGGVTAVIQCAVSPLEAFLFFWLREQLSELSPELHCEQFHSVLAAAAAAAVRSDGLVSNA